MVVAVGLVACGGDDGDDGGGDSAAVAHICREEIACGYQAADQASCEELFKAFFTADKIAACNACVTAEPCETQQSKCMSACTL